MEGEKYSRRVGKSNFGKFLMFYLLSKACYFSTTLTAYAPESCTIHSSLLERAGEMRIIQNNLDNRI